MKLLIWLWIALLYGLSYLPMWVLHRFSDLLYLSVYYGIGYRRKVVRENLEIAFPALSVDERLRIEKQFFRNFCDLVFEAIKTFSISKEELSERCVYTTPKVTADLFAKKVNLMGVSSHLANWEWKDVGLKCKRISGGKRGGTVRYRREWLDEFINNSGGPAKRRP